MTDTIEKTVLMKCEACGYQEEVPLKTLIDLRDLDDGDIHEDKLLCPFCLNYMYPTEDISNKQ